jgi:hypothetical protein
MIEFGNHYLLNVSSGLRTRVREFFATILECATHSSDDVTRDLPENVDLFVFPGGETVGVPYFDDGAPMLSNAEHRMACWMEIKTDDVPGLKAKLLEFGVDEITDFWDKERFYFHAPGGQVFRVIDRSKQL